MEVSIKTSACHFSKIHPEIEPLRIHRPSKHFNTLPCKTMHFEKLFIRQQFILGRMSIGSNHKMPRIIRKGIENHKTRFPSEENQTCLIIILFWKITKDTPVMIL